MASTQMRRDVEGEEYGEPHHVDEMPVDGAERHGGVALRSEIAEQHPYQERQQDQEPDDHMGHVETRNGEIKRAIRVRRDGEGTSLPLEDLDRDEHHAEHDADQQTGGLLPAHVLAQAALRPPHRNAAENED